MRKQKNRRIWQEPSRSALITKSLQRVGFSIELSGAYKTEITPGGILIATGFIGIRFVDSFFLCFISVLTPEMERKMEKTIGMRIRECRTN